MARNTQKHGKLEMHTVGSGIWREKLKNEENKKCTLQELEYGEKTEKCRKEKTHTAGHIIWLETLKKVKNEKCTFQDLEYGEKTENRG